MGALGNQLVAALPRDVFALLERDFKQVSLAEGFVCYESGDRIDQIYFPLTGMISQMIATGDGNTVEAATVGREGAAGLQSGLGERRSFTRTLVQIAGRFSILSTARFARAADDSKAVRELVFRYTGTIWAEAQQLAACNAMHDGSSRLCRWLLQSSDRIGSDQLQLTQEFLAGMLGVRRTTVTLLAQELQKQGIVKYSRGRISIIDRPALEARACECYTATRNGNPPQKVM